MGELADVFRAIGGLAFGALIILLIAPIVGPSTPVNLTGLGFMFLAGAVALTVALIIAVIRIIAEL